MARQVDPGNRRNYILRPTSQGRRIAGEAERRGGDAFTERFLDGDVADLRRLAEYSARYNAAD
ncbi:hypothetical protein ACFQZZ_25670 [Nocardia sp. GCM10030253]|uniref:hypothetical protein n=1 Tax=Nocardia sp. GCM10030253 TaxID=3273404 RepID=UPI003633C056